MSDPQPVVLNLDKITQAFLNIREARAALRQQYDKSDEDMKAAQERIEAAMLDHLNTSGAESVRTEAGTFYRQIDIKPSGADWQAFYDWIKEHDAWDALERRIKKTFISEYMEAHQGCLPPGVNVHREYVVRVRKAS